MDDERIFGRIDELVDEEHRLHSSGDALSPEERERLTQVEQTLDQCWDLLRQRRARRDAGQNPDDAKPRPVGEVESYLQ